MTASKTETPHPPVAGRDEWLALRKDLLTREKAHTRAGDALAAERRRMPMVRVDKEYTFDGPDGKVRLLDLFEGRTQLIVYHFMFDPAWDKGCPGCTGYINCLGDLSILGERNTSFALISRAPLQKLEKYKAEHGWPWRWVSSLGTDFNYDFHVTLDPKVMPMEYNYRVKDEGSEGGEASGHSVFFRLGDEIYHTYSCFARGSESLCEGYGLLDITPYGRQEDWETSPAGWPQRPTYG